MQQGGLKHAPSGATTVGKMERIIKQIREPYTEQIMCDRKEKVDMVESRSKKNKIHNHNHEYKGNKNLQRDRQQEKDEYERKKTV